MDRSRGGPPGSHPSREWTESGGSERRTVSAVFPTDWVEAMFRRARRWRRAEGGRFEAHAAAIVLWSAEQPPRAAHVVGWLSVRWDSPGPGQATIYEVGWVPGHGGSPQEMCRAIQLLSGLWAPGVRLDL